MISPATVFPGKDNLYGTTFDVRPFNNYMQQATSLNRLGNTLWLAPDIHQTDLAPAFSYDAINDELQIRVEITNTGGAPFPSTLYLAAYQGSVAAANMVAIDSLPANVNVGDTTTVRLTLRPFAPWQSLSGLILRLNDRGQATAIKQECDTMNNIVAIPLSNLLKAYHDRAATTTDLAVHVPVLRNDSIPYGCTPIPEVITYPQHGMATTVGDSIRYISTTPGFTGNDTLTYRIICGSDTSTAAIYIYVAEKPDNITESDCYVEPIPLKWTMQEVSGIDQTEMWLYQPPVIGDIDGDSIPEIIVSNNTLNGIRVYKGNDLSNIRDFPITGGVLPNIGLGLGLVRTKVSETDSETLIIAHLSNGLLQAYYVSGGLKWSTTPYTHFASISTVTFGFADFNHDGYAEIYMGNKIFDAATGVLLCEGVGNTGLSPIWTSNLSYITAVGDVLGTGSLQLAAGNQIYEVILNNRTSVGNLMTVVKTLPAFTMENGSAAPTDGSTMIADVNNDGLLDVIVRKTTFAAGSDLQIYVWTPSLGVSGQVLARRRIPNIVKSGLPMIGDIDGDKYPEIVLLSGVNTADVHNDLDSIYALKYIPGNDVLDIKWGFTHHDASGFTGLTLFDFNQDGISELVYRDNDNMRVINGSKKSHITGNDTIVYDLITPIACRSGTAAEYPVVADIDGDGHAEIITGGPPTVGVQPPWVERGALRVFKGGDQASWSPARSVWNQPAYNPAHVNDDLTVPRYPVSPTTFFPGRDGLIGTADDIQPYNSFMQQQTVTDTTGIPIWLTPDAKPVAAISSTVYIDSVVHLTLGITNIGDAAIGSKVFVTLYKNSVAGAVMDVDSFDIVIHTGDTATVHLSYVDTAALNLPYVIAARVNDRYREFAYVPECDSSNNVLNLGLMTKASVLNSVPHIGRNSNPVSVLGNEQIYYTLRASNPASLNNEQMIIIDTLPAYMKVVNGSVSTPVSIDSITVPYRHILRWVRYNVFSHDTVTVIYRATPAAGVSASQPLFPNRAWVTTFENESPQYITPTNYTYHQGAGVAVVSFSASLGGTIFGATSQAVDYRSTASTGVLVAPDSGYIFAGWKHEAYTSLRGEVIPAAEGITRYEELEILGDIELHAVFEPDLPKVNPVLSPISFSSLDDKIWSYQHTLYIRTQKSGSIARIYTASGTLYDQRTIITEGTTPIKLPPGIYVVTLNNGTGRKVAVN
jgi:hypothetical protein